MNEHKVGRLFDFPDSYIEFLSFLKVGFNVLYRMIEGAVEALSEYISFIQETCFTQSRRRMARLMKGKQPAQTIIRTQNDSGANHSHGCFDRCHDHDQRSVHRGRMEEGEKKVPETAHPG
jgi:hypothetical protein